MEKPTVDKEKLIKFLESEMKNAPDNYIAGIKWIAYIVEKGTFDVDTSNGRH